MKVFFHEDFYEEYTSDPAAETGRMEAIVKEIEPFVDIVSCEPASEEILLAAHSKAHIEEIRRVGLFDIAALAAGGAIQTAEAGLKEPSFGLIRPPGHHASSNSCWGFCFFNNMAVSIYHLKRNDLMDRAFILDFDFHFGDGNVNILGSEPWVEILNPESHNRKSYLDEVEKALSFDGPWVKGVRFGIYVDKIRVVFDLIPEAGLPYDIISEEGRLVVSFKPGSGFPIQ